MTTLVIPNFIPPHKKNKDQRKQRTKEKHINVDHIAYTWTNAAPVDFPSGKRKPEGGNKPPPAMWWLYWSPFSDLAPQVLQGNLQDADTGNLSVTEKWGWTCDNQHKDPETLTLYSQYQGSNPNLCLSFYRMK